MSQNVARPTLTGQRIKTRRRDEKEKYDPSAFRDSIIKGLTEAHGDTEQVDFIETFAAMGHNEICTGCSCFVMSNYMRTVIKSSRVSTACLANGNCNADCRHPSIHAYSSIYAQGSHRDC